VDDRIAALVARTDVDQVDMRPVQVQLVLLLENGRREDELDTGEIVVFGELLSRGHDAGVDSLHRFARCGVLDARRKVPRLFRVGHNHHAFRYRAVRDDLAPSKSWLPRRGRRPHAY
jgi:hypothetical protein